MKKAILDTNAVLEMVEFKIDLFLELERVLDFSYQVCVVEGTIGELEKVKSSSRLRFSRAAKMGIAILKAKKVKVLPGEGQVDDVLTAYSRQGALIVTQDRELKRRLQKPFLTIRQKKFLVIVN